MSLASSRRAWEAALLQRGAAVPAPARRPRRRNREPEHDEQVALIEMVELYRSSVPELWMLFAVPNGGKRGRGTGGKLKAEGAQRGVQDLLLPVRRGGLPGLAIEMKADGGRLSQDQIEWRDLMRWQGWRVEVCYTWQEAWAVICEYLEVNLPGYRVAGGCSVAAA